MLYLLAIIYVLYNSRLVFVGVSEGVNVVIHTLIPSLFIVMIICSLLSNSKVVSVLAYPFGFLARRVFKVNKSLFTVVILSLVGGYPIGAKILNEYVAAKKISPTTAGKMLNYCVNSGPAFLISGIGVSLFLNIYVGIFIYLSQVTACLITGFICGILYKKQSKEDIANYCDEASSSIVTLSSSKPEGFSVSLLNAVTSSIKAMSILSGLVILFCGITYPLLEFVSRYLEDFSNVIKGFLEVTAGVSAIFNSSLNNKVELICAITAFGGICVHLQVLALTTKIPFSYLKFLGLRIIYTAISVEIIKLFLKYFPQTTDCLSVNTSIVPSISSKSPYALILLCFLSLIYICSIKGRKKV